MSVGILGACQKFREDTVHFVMTRWGDLMGMA